MNIKDYLKRNGMTLILLVGMIILYLCIPSQIAENMVAKATISPRFFPTFSVLGVIVCCALLLVFDAKEHIFSHKTAEAAATQEKKEEVSYVRVVLVALLLLAWYILMPRIGFIISTIVIMCIMSYLLGCRNKIVLVAFPVIFTLAVYFTFVELLHVSLPEILF
ncbi:tripartite tricarboxylate transporter TctB family protein [Intestinimonas massiliensis (ex Afouda et al. 2020)]|uniref:tripartite tricarboxylate transporter TctB family protein n=1 Tax=Intestinimonas massiliensis (ex Afouda et al. 2020) TaxID=1673721 RepID=UPI00067F224E|nr:tripartite tricarboxylate transporter TctB family protein [Intestinimonas massiliensis (ex Afouda et al. 2020)]MDU1326075.1 tripartite tricarboxylate transporter TctB family protein [Clostridiales bacterium]